MRKSKSTAQPSSAPDQGQHEARGTELQVTLKETKLSDYIRGWDQNGCNLTGTGHLGAKPVLGALSDELTAGYHP